MFRLSVLDFEIHLLRGAIIWRFGLISIETYQGIYDLLSIEYDCGKWKFDFLFLRHLIYFLRRK